MIGVPLEMVHGILRISLLYMAGVLAGRCLGKRNCDIFYFYFFGRGVILIKYFYVWSLFFCAVNQFHLIGLWIERTTTEKLSFNRIFLTGWLVTLHINTISQHFPPQNRFHDTEIPNNNHTYKNSLFQKSLHGQIFNSCWLSMTSIFCERRCPISDYCTKNIVCISKVKVTLSFNRLQTH